MIAPAKKKRKRASPPPQDRLSLTMLTVRKCLRTKRIRLIHVVIIVLFSILFYIFYLFGVFEYPFQIPFIFYSYPLDVDLRRVVENIKHERPAGVEPINNYDYKRILSNDGKCVDKDVFVLLMVKSAVNHFVRRAFIRRTWGKETTVLGQRVATVFLIGEHPGEHTLQQDVRREHAQFNDLVQDAFIDSYWNNTIKMMEGFHWAIEHCRNARYVVFTDDDYFVKPDNLVRYLIETREASIISGFVWSRAVPLRYKWSKWYTPLSEYPYWYWPPYPAGGAFSLPMKSAVDLTIAMHYTKYLRFDDVFLGIVAWKLGIGTRHDKRFYIYKVPYSKWAYKDLIACHGYDDSNEILDAWRQEYPNQL